MTGTTRLLLGLAAVAVAFAAADTYVVVLALPEMAGAVGVSTEELQRAAPIISGFLLGYVAMLPLIGRIADLRGRVPVLVAALVVFAFGSLVTTLAYDLPTMVSGRFLQGLGGGGLVPTTLALVADLYPRERRGVPLGVVSAVQELASVIGPLFGAVVLAVADWRVIFLVNLAVGLVLAAAIRALRFGHKPQDFEPGTRGLGPNRSLPDLAGGLLLLLSLTAGALVFVRPPSLLRDLTWGRLFIPFAGDGRWLTPLGTIAALGAALFAVRCFTARRPLVDGPGWMRSMRDADLAGATFLAVALGGVILAFATADPKIQLIADQGYWYLTGSAVATAALVVHLRRTDTPLVPRGALRRTPAWGAILVSFFVGAALIAALVDVPLFARTTIHRDSQLMAALVLLRFLVALPVGAVLGGYLTRRFSAGLITAVGMLMAAAGFALMTQWDISSLEHLHADATLVLCGFGFGLALAPVNAAILASTDDVVHGLAGAMVVAARMVGMLVGISALTAASDLLTGAGISQEHAVFAGAAVCALLAAGCALVVFRGAATRSFSAADVLRAGG